jgi:hypothetical protein
MKATSKSIKDHHNDPLKWPIQESTVSSILHGPIRLVQKQLFKFHVHRPPQPCHLPKHLPKLLPINLSIHPSLGFPELHFHPSELCLLASLILPVLT